MHLILSQPSEEYAAALSAALWNIRRPPATRSDLDTQLYTSWTVHPEDGRVALFIPDDTSFIHPDADITPLVDLITDMPLSIPGYADVETLETNVSAYINSHRGSRLSFRFLVESSPAAVNLRTDEQLTEEGWFMANA